MTQKESSENNPLLILDLEVDLRTETVKRNGEELELPDLSFKLLAALIEGGSRTISKDDLVSRVWDGLVVSDETLSQRVRLLRLALGEDAHSPRYINAVRGKGYRLIPPVVNADDAQAASSSARRKNLSLILVLVMIVGVAYFWWDKTTKVDKQLAQPIDTSPSIAVLPFSDLSPEQSYRYFADGMQEELLSRLAKLENLNVISRTSAEQYRNSDKPLPQIARELGAQNIIESSVRVSGENVRITVQLIDAQSDAHLWAETYDRRLSVENIFAIQQDVAEKISGVLSLKLSSNNRAATILPTQNIEAYNAYLIGNSHIFASTSNDLELAVTSLQNAIELDPEFAEAWTSLGLAYSFLGTVYGQRAPREVFPKARDALLKALSLKGSLIDARALYADILTWFDWDFKAAEKEYQKVLASSNDHVLGYAVLLSVLGRHDEAIALNEQFIRHHPEGNWGHINASWNLLRAGQYQRSIEHASKAERHPDSGKIMGFAQLALGNIEQAVGAFEKNLREQGRHPRELSNLAAAYYKAGRHAEAREILAELEAHANEKYVAPELIANVYFAGNNANRGFIKLQEAVEARSRGLIFLQSNQWLDDYRDDPRYMEILGEVGLDHAANTASE